MIFQLPEKLGMVAARMAVLQIRQLEHWTLSPFSPKRCCLRLLRIARLWNQGASQDYPNAGLGSGAGSLYTLLGPAPAPE